MYYTIPSNNWELQLKVLREVLGIDYTIPSNNWELQHNCPRFLLSFIIPYQVITGNYSDELGR